MFANIQFESSTKTFQIADDGDIEIIEKIVPTDLTNQRKVEVKGNIDEDEENSETQREE